jgi:hypothetical protein
LRQVKRPLHLQISFICHILAGIDARSFRLLTEF